MCGIIGWLGRPSQEIGIRMRDTMSHRGPDSAGEWSDPDRKVWLGHRRLAIIDLTSEGHQPMLSQSGRFVITYNGEVFNYLDIKKELELFGLKFRGHSDTEVIIAAIEEWGVAAAVRRFVGMYAFGVYDRQEQRIWLVRDRLGIKPLYYANHSGEFAFASELQALKQLPWLDQTIDKNALYAYFRYLCVPAPATIIKGAKKLPPASILCWDGKEVIINCYWDHKEVVKAGLQSPIECGFSEAADELELKLKESVRLRMLADVPLGAFLSGGVDSSLVVALMQVQSDRPIKTYNIGFTEESHDESPFARAIASHLGTEHHELILTPANVIDLIPKISSFYDEPFADSSNVPTYLVSRFARNGVTVALSGDGGDELFGGYPRYFWASRIQRLKQRLAPWGSRLFGHAIERMPDAFWDKIIANLGGKKLAGSEGLSARVQRFGRYLVTPLDRIYEEMISAWKNPADLLCSEPQVFLGPDLNKFNGINLAEQMMAVDQENQLVDDFLTKVDRASMRVSLEVRVPLLDHRLVEWSWRVPAEYKMLPHGDRGKLLLREVLYRYVPKYLIERPKMGFGMPMGRWLRKELRPWAEELLNPTSLSKIELLNPSAIQRVWEEHLDGADRLPQIWTVLMFLQWQESWRSCGR